MAERGTITYAGHQPHAPYAVFALHPEHGRIPLAIVGTTFDTGRLEGEAVVLLPDGTTCVVSGLASRGIEPLGVGLPPDPLMLTAEQTRRLADAATGTAAPALLVPPGMNGGMG
jgi:hypothetical protein